MATKSTSPKVAAKAGKLLEKPSTGKSSKSVAGSALSQVNPKKTTSTREATTASKVMRDGRTSSSAKSAAGSVLSQAQAGPRKKLPATTFDSTSKSGKGTGSGGPRTKKI